MHRYLLSCLLLCAVPVVAQTVPDSVQVLFQLQRPATHQTVVNVVSGAYKLPPENRVKFSLPGNALVYVHPAQLKNPDGALQITALQQRFAETPYYVLPFAATQLRDYTPAMADYYNLNTPERAACLAAQRFIMDTLNIKPFALRYEGYEIPAGSSNNYVKYTSQSRYQYLNIASYRSQAAIYRDSVRLVVDSVLRPFYMSTTEITNSQYRAFVHWVRDSIAFTLLYNQLPPQQALKLLNGTNQQHRLLDPEQKAANLQLLGFDYSALRHGKTPIYQQEALRTILQPMYRPQPERFYKRREFDTQQFVYRSAAISPTPIYPDTLCWLRDATYSRYEELTKEYYWHPVYDHYAVNGLTEQQMRAYCDWYEQRLNEQLRSKGWKARVTLPSLVHYEMAVKACAIPARIPTINAEPPAPFVLHRDSIEAYSFITSAGTNRFSEKCLQGELCWKVANAEQYNETLPIAHLADGMSEYVAFPTPADSSGHPQMTVLGANRFIALIDQQENQLNNTFYRQQLPAGKGSSIVGFRIVVYVEPLREKEAGD